MIVLWKLLLVAVSGFDPEIDEQVALLGNPKFRVRESATKALLGKDVWALPHLAFARKFDPELEVSRRAGFVITRYVNEVTSFSGAMPYIDCLPSYYPNRDGVLEKYYERFGPPRYNQYPAYYNNDHLRHATTAFFGDLFAEGRSRSEVIRLRDDMWYNEGCLVNGGHTQGPVKPER